VSAVLVSLSVFAHEPVPAADSEPAGEPLSIQEAVRVAVTDQPILLNREALAAAEEQQAISVAQLPDPKLTLGLKDLPIDRGEAFSVRDDNFTMFAVGISQAFPRAEKRRLLGEQKRLDAQMEHYGLLNDRKIIERDASSSWLDVYEAEQALELTHQLVLENNLQVLNMESGYRNGRNSQADWLAAKVEAELAADKEQDWRHHVDRLRAAQGRWVGEAAHRPLLPDLSTIPANAQLAEIVTGIQQHPAVSSLQSQVEASQNEVARARQAYKPDFALEAYVAHRPAYSDLVGLQFSVDLPFFTDKRQDPELRAARLRSQAAADRKDDLLRELRAQATEYYVDWHHAAERAANFDREIIPEAQRRTEAAKSAYASAKGSFDGVLLARRALLEIQIQRLALLVESARAQTRLQYLTSTGETP
jgi:outer membrane protein TolC